MDRRLQGIPCLNHNNEAQEVGQVQVRPAQFSLEPDDQIS